MNKSANLSSGPTGTVITYTFTIANTGNAAGDLTLTDALGTAPPPACSTCQARAPGPMDRAR